MAGEPGKRHDVCAHYPEDVSDWLNPLALGTMSASAYIRGLYIVCYRNNDYHY